MRSRPTSDRSDMLRTPLRCLAGLLVLGAAMLATPAQAQTDAELRLGFYTDPEAVSFGGGLLTPLGGAPGWMFNPNIEVAVADFSNVISINPDFHYDFPTESSVAYWLGAGPALMFIDRDGGDTDTDFGVNMFAGLGAKYGGARPFAQLKGVISDNSRLAITGGLRF